MKQTIRCEPLIFLAPHLLSVRQGHGHQFGCAVDNQGVVRSRKVAHGYNTGEIKWLNNPEGAVQVLNISIPWSNKQTSVRSRAQAPWWICKRLVHKCCLFCVRVNQFAIAAPFTGDSEQILPVLNHTDQTSADVAMFAGSIHPCLCHLPIRIVLESVERQRIRFSSLAEDHHLVFWLYRCDISNPNPLFDVKWCQNLQFKAAFCLKNNKNELKILNVKN